MHYQRWLNRGSTDDPPKRGATRAELVRVRAARRPVTQVTCGHPERKHYAKGMCSPCYQTISNKPWRARNRTKLALGNRARHHGLTVAQVKAAWLAQDGKCANPRCEAVFDIEHPDHRNGMQIDHDHVTNLFRGLLCKPCNSTLGHAGDDVARLLGLVEYLGAPLN